MQDFTLKTYKALLKELTDKGYSFQTIQEFIGQAENKTVILRHDVDQNPGNSLNMARLEDEMGIGATYYFRTIPQIFKPDIIKEISEFGHEIGYHYENLSEIGIGQRVTSKERLFELAISNFRFNLAKLRKFYPVKTICMHGSPLYKWDNRDLWNNYDYREYGILAEPYFDVDYNKVFYLTDTGRSWNNSKASVRDKVNSKFDITIKDTNHLIEKIKNSELPDKIMINVHPQRWTDKPLPWIKELVGQNVKNVIKRYLLKFRSQ